MRIPLLFIVFALVFSTNPASAHFFPNVSSIPRSLDPQNTSWDGFQNLLGCHNGQKVAGIGKLKQYFQRFGYMNSSQFNFTDDFDDYMEFAVKTYQRNFNINTTGELDATTLQRIVRPRCGNADVINGSTSMNSGKASSPANSVNTHTVAHFSYFPGQPRWPESTTELTYAFSPETQVDQTTRDVFARAFERWSEVIPMTFSETATFATANIKIGFFSGDHNDGEPFDGVLGTLAHAFSPPNGRFHLDADENWVINGDFSNAPSVRTAIDLESVAVHEIGHLLGLGHSSDESAIMFPSISTASRKTELALDDITGIQQLYGSNPNFNGSVPALTPRDQGQFSGSQRMSTFGSHTILLVAGFLFFFHSLVNFSFFC